MLNYGCKGKGLYIKTASQNRKYVALFGTIGDYTPETGSEYIPHFCGKGVQNRR